MTIKGIKKALKAGKIVHWANDGYNVILDKACINGIGVLCTKNDYYTGLQTEEDPDDCYIEETMIVACVTCFENTTLKASKNYSFECPNCKSIIKSN